MIAKFWLGLAVLVILSPLGLILPWYFKAGAGWGEWNANEIRDLVGYLPAGIEKLSSLWKAPMPDYSLQGWEGRGLAVSGLSYIISSAIGIIAVVLSVWLIARILVKNNK